SIAAEEQRRTQIINGSLTGAAAGTGAFFEAAPGLGGILLPIGTSTGTGYAGHDVPDVVANLRIDQAWGSAQVMGALHNVSTTYYSCVAPGAATASVNEGCGHPDDKLGFAVGAGIKLNAPMFGPGDYFQAEVDYTQGASRYSNHTAGVWNYVIYSGSTIGYGFNTDAVYANGTDLELTTSWAVNAAFTHNWNAAWKSTLWGSYMAQSYSTAGNNILCTGNPAVANAGCDNDWNIWGAGLRTQWAVSS